MMVGYISGKLPTTKDMEKASLYPKNKYTKANTIKMLKFKDAKKTETVFIKVSFKMEKDTVKVNSLGTMANFSKDNGKTVRKMVSGSGNHQKVIIMKVNGQIIDKQEKDCIFI